MHAERVKSRLASHYTVKAALDHRAETRFQYKLKHINSEIHYQLTMIKLNAHRRTLNW